MVTVSEEELRENVRAIVDRAAAGEQIVVTREGQPVAELRPVRRLAVPTDELIEAWKSLPRMDSDALRRDIDAVLDTSL